MRAGCSGRVPGSGIWSGSRAAGAHCDILVAVPATPAATPAQPAPGEGEIAPGDFRLDPGSRRVYLGLVLGMLVASISQTIVSPAMPRIVAELGGMEHYSWLATGAMLVSAVTVPTVGKLSDLYGRRRFYLGGLAVFMAGSALSGAATNFWFLIAARMVQGLGMGTIMPLAQTIVGDIIPPRYRGKYQGIMGSIFGVTSIAGPLAGGWITDELGWRWLFYIALPFGLVAFGFIWRFLRIPHQRRDAPVDITGFITLPAALVVILLATSLGGTTLPWGSPQIAGMYAAGGVLLAAFVITERRAAEPVIPLRLFRSSVFTCANIANLAVAMLMFGVMVYVPVFAQGVLGFTASESGMALVPMSAAMVVMSLASGMAITRTGRYKAITLTGIAVMGAGLWLLTRLGPQSHTLELSGAVAVFGVGLGMCQQVFTLVVQNIVQRRDLGVATATTQFFRSSGATIGVALFGSVMSSQTAPAIAARLPEGTAAGEAAGIDAGSVLDPSALAGLPGPLVQAVRYGLGDALHLVFLSALPLAVLAFVAAACVKPVPLRTTMQSPQDSGRQMLDTMSQTSGQDIVQPLPRSVSIGRTDERILGMRAAILSASAAHPEHTLLRAAVTRLGDGDLERGRALLDSVATMLTSEDDTAIRGAEPAAVALAARTREPEGVLGEELSAQLVVAVSNLDPSTTRYQVEEPVAARYETLDLDRVHTAISDVNAVLLVDLAARLQAGSAGAGSSGGNIQGNGEGADNDNAS